MIGNNAKGHARLIGSVFLVGQLFSSTDDGGKEVGVEDTVDILKHRAEASQTHTRVNAGARQGVKVSILVPVILHEHVIPDL